MTKTPIITASSTLLYYYRVFFILYIDEVTGRITIKNQFLKSFDKIRQNTDDNLSPQDSRLCIPLALLHSAFDKLHEQPHSVLHIPQGNFNQWIHILNLKNAYHFSFMFVLTAKWINIKSWDKTNLQFYFFPNFHIFRTIVSPWIVKVRQTLPLKEIMRSSKGWSFH